MEDEILEKFKEFLNDREAGELYITGVAGTGKTTCLGSLLQWCLDGNIKSITTAYTHKACGILRNKLPKKAAIQTLHSFLKKRPTINDRAYRVEHVEGNAQVGAPDPVKILFIDEFSMVGERDFVDINAIQYNEDGDLITKVVYIGDPNQLPPVKDARAVYPKGKHWIKLTKIHRQKDDNPLIDTLLNLNAYISGKDPAPLQEHATFKRGKDIVKLYKECSTSKIILAYTNAQVEFLNSFIEGKQVPSIRDAVYSPTLREAFVIDDINDTADNIVTINGSILELDSKYKTLETIHDVIGVKFYTLSDEDNNISQRAVIFGHDSYLQKSQALAKTAVSYNNEIKHTYNCDDPTKWCKENWSNPLTKKRSKAWGRYLSFKECVICLDFPHAMTVHKSQGSTYENVFLDTEDMGKCANNDYTMYLKLLYVAISRASKCVYTN